MATCPNLPPARTIAASLPRPRRTGVSAAVLALLAAGCASRPAALCSGAGLAVDASFAQARLSACAVAPDGRISAEIQPETVPVNPSPWYAFRVRGAQRGAEVALGYASAGHRYHPWVREGRGDWQRLPDAAVTPQGTGAIIRLPPARRPLLMAAQPFTDPQLLLRPWEARAARGMLRAQTVGRSSDGRPLRLFLHQPPQPQGLVVLLARQHPPEISGALAFEALAARLLDASPESRALRARHAILFAPVMNPDGLVRGHWRGNAAGIDLNRDWGPFTQPETRAVAARVAELATRFPQPLLLDLHSTRRNILYAHPLDFTPNARSEAFITAFLATPEGRDWPVLRRHEDRGGSPGAFKAWTWEALRQPSITFEVADNATPEAARAIGRAAADAILTTMAGDEAD